MNPTVKILPWLAMNPSAMETAQPIGPKAIHHMARAGLCRPLVFHDTDVQSSLAFRSSSLRQDRRLTTGRGFPCCKRAVEHLRNPPFVFGNSVLEVRASVTYRTNEVNRMDS